MAGIGDRVAVVGDWAPPDPSPRTFFSTALGGDESFSEFQGHNGWEGFFSGSYRQKAVVSGEKENDTTSCGLSCDLLSEPALFSSQKSSSRGGLAKRMATRAGFNAPKINTATIRSGNLSSSPEVRSPYLTIPPGLSPTTLLDSPVFLSNSLAQPSPTTSKISFAHRINDKSSMLISESHKRNNDIPFEELGILSAVFKRHTELSSLVLPIDKKIMPENKPLLPIPDIEVSVQSEELLQFRSFESTEVHLGSHNGLYEEAEFSKSSTGKNSTRNNVLSDLRTLDNTSIGESQHLPSLDEQQDGEGNQGANGELSSMVGGGYMSEDGYSWRKYGQKQVKGSEYPRSYYKCMHPNCQVKKKVERSHKGHITEIIYKGVHNHPKPPPNRRSVVGSSNTINEVQRNAHEQGVPHAATDGDAAWAGMKWETVRGPDLRFNNLEVTSPASASPELCDPSSFSQVQDDPHFDHGDAVDVSSTLSNDDDDDDDEEEDDRGTHGNQSLDYDCKGDESESKRRKINACTIEMSGTTRANREPRVVVQTRSEVDILDDGYRWRKYGQKIVKGNPNPRSYYKCTSAGCMVRKHVERASHDLKSVITTYEGKHNHDVPTARNNSHVSPSSSDTTSVPGAQAHVHRPEPSQARDSMVRFGSSASLNSLSLPGRQQLGIASDFSFELNHPSLNLTTVGLGPGQGKLPILPVYPYVGWHHQLNRIGTVMPKGEPKEEPVTDTGMNLAKGSSVHHSIVNRHPHLHDPQV